MFTFHLLSSFFSSFLLANPFSPPPSFLFHLFPFLFLLFVLIDLSFSSLLSFYWHVSFLLPILFFFSITFSLFNQNFLSFPSFHTFTYCLFPFFSLLPSSRLPPFHSYHPPFSSYSPYPAPPSLYLLPLLLSVVFPRPHSPVVQPASAFLSFNPLFFFYSLLPSSLQRSRFRAHVPLHHSGRRPGKSEQTRLGAELGRHPRRRRHSGNEWALLSALTGLHSLWTYVCFCWWRYHSLISRGLTECGLQQRCWNVCIMSRKLWKLLNERLLHREKAKPTSNIAFHLRACCTWDSFTCKFETRVN